MFQLRLDDSSHMIDFSSAYTLDDARLQPWLSSLQPVIAERFHEKNIGNLPCWIAALQQLPTVTPSHIDLNEPAIVVGRGNDISEAQRTQLEYALRTLHPWRKGPFDLFGLYIDTEWRSDWKWDRLKNHITPLTGRTVLDIGCGSGYHCWRMRGAGAKTVIGIEPTVLFIVQFHALQHYIRDARTHLLPLRIEDMPTSLHAFDSVFSMGILYHRRSPLDHLLELKSLLRPGGELILETLIIDGDNGATLAPEGRYAKMGNVWFIPSILTLESWLHKTGFTNVCCINVCATTIEEQRSTPWMTFQSLRDYLDPDDVKKTIEGHPAPQRAIFIANAG